MTAETQSFPESTGAPSFESIKLRLRYKKDGSQVQYTDSAEIDLLEMNVVGEIHYYETVFSPATSVMMTIVNPNTRTKLFEDYALLGGERVEFKIRDFLSHNSAEPGLTYAGVVTQVDNYTSNNFAEIFRIRITTEWRFPKGSGLSGTITGSPSEIAKAMIKGAYDKNPNAVIYEAGSTANLYADDATNEITINIGQEKKDNVMAVVMALAALSKTGERSAGYFFYRNKYGFQFRAIDKIISDGILGVKAKDPQNKLTNEETQDINFPAGYLYQYEYTGYNPGAVENPEASLFNAISFKVQTSDYAEKDQARLQGGNLFISADPLKYTFIASSQKNLNIGNELGWKYLKDSSFSIQSDYPDDDQLYYNTQNLGLQPSSLFKDSEGLSSLKFSSNPHQDAAIGRARYASLLSVSCVMTVPLNLNLIAGTMVSVNIPRLKPQQECNTEEEIVPSEYSGLYIIAAVCHAMDRKKGYSTLHIVRDFGKFNTVLAN